MTILGQLFFYFIISSAEIQESVRSGIFFVEFDKKFFPPLIAIFVQVWYTILVKTFCSLKTDTRTAFIRTDRI